MGETITKNVRTRWRERETLSEGWIILHTHIHRLSQIPHKSLILEVQASPGWLTTQALNKRLGFILQRIPLSPGHLGLFPYKRSSHPSHTLQVTNGLTSFFLAWDMWHQLQGSRAYGSKTSQRLNPIESGSWILTQDSNY
jgi:hypothetical protein